MRSQGMYKHTETTKAIPSGDKTKRQETKEDKQRDKQRQTKTKKNKKGQKETKRDEKRQKENQKTLLIEIPPDPTLAFLFVIYVYIVGFYVCTGGERLIIVHSKSLAHKTQECQQLVVNAMGNLVDMRASNGERTSTVQQQRLRRWYFCRDGEVVGHGEHSGLVVFHR